MTPKKPAKAKKVKIAVKSVRPKSKSVPIKIVKKVSFFPSGAPSWVKHGIGIFKFKAKVCKRHRYHLLRGKLYAPIIRLRSYYRCTYKYLVGVVGLGVASSLTEISDARHEAYLMAKKELTTFLAAKIASLAKQYVDNAYKRGVKNFLKKFYKSLILSLVEERKIVGAKIMKSYEMMTHGKYLVWLLLVWNPDTLTKLATKKLSSLDYRWDLSSAWGNGVTIKRKRVIKGGRGRIVSFYQFDKDAIRRGRREIMRQVESIKDKLIQPTSEDKTVLKLINKLVFSKLKLPSWLPKDLVKPKLRLDVKL